MSVGSRMVTYLFMAALILPALGFFIVPDKDVATIENRPAQKLPGVPKTLWELYHWTEHFDLFIKDHFPFRSRMIRENSKFWLSQGLSGSKEVIIGKDGWLFYARESNVTDKSRGIVKLTPKEKSDFSWEIERRTQLLKEQGIDYWLVIIPEKQSVYGHFLPDTMPMVGPSIGDQFAEAVSGHPEINCINLRPVIMAAMAENGGEKLYDMTDSHWNDYGSYLAYCEIVKRVGARRPLFHLENSMLQFTTDRIGGDLAKLLNLKEELAEVTKVASVLETGVVKTNEGQNYADKGWYAETSRKEACRGMILCDSYTNRFMKKYLKETFSYSFFHHHMNVGFDEGMIRNEKPDVVLFLVAERLIQFGEKEGA